MFKYILCLSAIINSEQFHDCDEKKKKIAPFKGRTEGQDLSIKLQLMHKTMVINPLKKHA